MRCDTTVFAPKWGHVPRHVLPTTCPPELRRCIDKATARCRSSALEKASAHKAQKQMELIGQQNAVDLIGNTR